MCVYALVRFLRIFQAIYEPSISQFGIPRWDASLALYVVWILDCIDLWYGIYEFESFSIEIETIQSEIERFCIIEIERILIV